jgi:hypothetical protein
MPSRCINFLIAVPSPPRQRLMGMLKSAQCFQDVDYPGPTLRRLPPKWKTYEAEVPHCFAVAKRGNARL